MLRSPVDVSLASIVFGQNRPRDGPSSSPHPPSNLFITCNLWTNHSALLGLGDQPTSFSELSSLMPINHELPDFSKLFHGDRGCHQPPGLHASAGLLHLLLPEKLGLPLGGCRVKRHNCECHLPYQ